MTVTQAHIDQYREEGATLVKGAFDAGWTAELEEDILSIRAVFARGGTPPPVVETASQNPPSADDKLYGGTELRNIAPCSRAIQRWIRESPAAGYVAALTGATTVRFWMDSTFIKEPETGQEATPWHTDGSTYPMWGEQMPTLWLALTDVPEDNAPMLTVAGSHKLPHRFHSGLSRQDVEVPGYRPWSELIETANAPDADVRLWAAERGDMLLMHPQMIHASRRRESGAPGRRIGLSTRWIGSDVVWRPDAYAVSIPRISGHPDTRHGEPPPEAVFPIVYRAEGA